MPRAKKSIPSVLEGRASLASYCEKASLDAQELANRLRKPTSLIVSPVIANAQEMLIATAQNLSDLAVALTLGKVQVREPEQPVEVQHPLFPALEGPSVN